MFGAITGLFGNTTAGAENSRSMNTEESVIFNSSEQSLLKEIKEKEKKKKKKDKKEKKDKKDSKHHHKSKHNHHSDSDEKNKL